MGSIASDKDQLVKKCLVKGNNSFLCWSRVVKTSFGSEGRTRENPLMVIIESISNEETPLCEVSPQKLADPIAFLEGTGK